MACSIRGNERRDDSGYCPTGNARHERPEDPPAPREWLVGYILSFRFLPAAVTP